MRLMILAAAIGLACVAPARADEVFVGAYKHGVDTPFTFRTDEHGADITAGYRFDGIEALHAVGKPEPYIIASVNTAGDTDFAGFGLSWQIGKGPVYLRPGAALVIHDGPSLRYAPDGTETDLGSRIVFEPEIGLGYRINDKVSVEASWQHLSHARLFNREQNPGIDMWGARVNWRL